MATNVSGVVMTSSPGPIPSASTAEVKRDAAVRDRNRVLHLATGCEGVLEIGDDGATGERPRTHRRDHCCDIRVVELVAAVGEGLLANRRAAGDRRWARQAHPIGAGTAVVVCGTVASSSRSSGMSSHCVLRSLLYTKSSATGVPSLASCVSQNACSGSTT